MANWPKNLVRDIARRRCIPVIGSGVSRQATGENDVRPPTWTGFLNDRLEGLDANKSTHIQKAIENGRLLEACEWLQQRYDYQWTSELRKAFSAPKFKPAKVHETIARLDTRIVFSLNFEDILDRALQEVHGGTCITKRYYDPDVSEFLRGADRYLIKVHGSLDEPDRLIFTQRQYAEARIAAAPFYNAFDSALMTNTFLFLGAGYNDPDINLILENQNFTYTKSHPHYFLCADGMHSDMKVSLRANRNLEVIEYEKVDGDHTGFPRVLEELLALVERERELIAESLDW